MTGLDLKQQFTAFQNAKNSLVYFRHIFLSTNEDEVKPAPYHFVWSDSLLHGKNNDAFEGFRESGKTQIVLRAFMLHCFMFPTKDRDYIVLIKNNARLAGDKLKEIEDEFTANPAFKSGLLKIREQSGEVFSVDMRDYKGEILNIRVEAYGKGASIRGLAHIDRRPKVVIVDDPQDIEDAQSPTIQAKDWDWFLSDVMFLGKSTRLFVIGNNLGEGCILERIAANCKDLNFNFTRIPQAINDVPTWPARDSIDKIKAERQNFQNLGKVDIWLREKMCLAVADENRVFVKDDFQFYNPVRSRDFALSANRYIALDPASSLDDKSDYRVIMTNLVTPDNKWVIPSVKYGRWDTGELFDHLFNEVLTWEIKDVGIEDGIWKQALNHSLTAEMRRRNQFFNVIPLKHGGRRKEDRIEALKPRFKTHSILFPETADWLAEMLSELLAFTKQGMKGLHDDLLDTLAYFEQFITVPYRSSGIRAALPRETENNYSILGAR